MEDLNQREKWNFLFHCAYQKRAVGDVRCDTDLRLLIIPRWHKYNPLLTVGCTRIIRIVALSENRTDALSRRSCRWSQRSKIHMPAATTGTVETLKEGYGLMFYVVGAIVIVHVVAVVR